MDWQLFVHSIGGTAVGVAAGAWIVQAAMNHRLQKALEKFKLDLQTQSNRDSRAFERQLETYAQFIVWDRAALTRTLSQKLARLALMAAHASVETIRAIADYERLGGVACSDVQKKAFVRMFNAIRAEINAAPVSEDDLLTFPT